MFDSPFSTCRKIGRCFLAIEEWKCWSTTKFTEGVTSKCSIKAISPYGYGSIPISIFRGMNIHICTTVGSDFGVNRRGSLPFELHFQRFQRGRICCRWAVPAAAWNMFIATEPCDRSLEWWAGIGNHHESFPNGRKIQMSELLQCIIYPEM